ncbi:MAG: MBL fold metallo-hydrolase [Gemmatimonadota bacterium]|nr:MBL fold metallo-hydrolase [Gemmatimonadota bacterium]MDH3422177.1 MBL fold metallo-hydrolase [Gemmatimonadota bacterium]
MKRVPYLLCGLLACALPVAAQDFDQIQITTTPVRGSIYMLQGSGGNIGVSIGDDGTMIVDDQFGPLTQKITAAIARLTPNPVNYVVNSHWHYDHSDGNVNFGRAGATIVAHENSRTRMMSDQIVSLSNRLQEAYSEEGLPKITFYRSMRFHYNDDAIDVVHLGPAHTNGDAFVYFRDTNVIHTGDVYVRYGLPFIDNPNGGSISGMIESVWTIAGMIDDDTIVIPGHGQLSNRDDMLAYRAMLVTIRDRMQTLMDQGRTPDQIVAANPTRGYAEPGPGTERWIRAAFDDLSR